MNAPTYKGATLKGRAQAPAPQPTSTPLVTFTEAERNVRQAGAGLSFREKLRWLEDAERLARRLGRQNDGCAGEAKERVRA